MKDKVFLDTNIAETMLENKIYPIITENTADFSAQKIRAINPFKRQTP